MFKDEVIGVDVQELIESIENMNAEILNYWLSKFVQEVSNKSGGRYPSRTLYGIVRGCVLLLMLKVRHMESTKGKTLVMSVQYFMVYFR